MSAPAAGSSVTLELSFQSPAGFGLGDAAWPAWAWHGMARLVQTAVAIRGPDFRSNPLVTFRSRRAGRHLDSRRPARERKRPSITRNKCFPVAACVTVSRCICTPDLHGPSRQHGLRVVPRGRLPSERCLDGMAIVPGRVVAVLGMPRCEMHCRSRLFDFTWATNLQ